MPSLQEYSKNVSWMRRTEPISVAASTDAPKTWAREEGIFITCSPKPFRKPKPYISILDRALVKGAPQYLQEGLALWLSVILRRDVRAGATMSFGSCEMPPANPACAKKFLETPENKDKKSDVWKLLIV